MTAQQSASHVKVAATHHENLLHSEYGKSSKELIEFIGQLRALGAHIDLELPRIVVIGNQSAGKSSLVEAISGISVPRDAGTCTRCPMECRLTHSTGAWSCQVKIRFEYDQEGERLDEVDEVEFGSRITDKAEVEHMLRRAQEAVLHPGVDYKVFLEDGWREKIKGKQPLRFSQNVVCIELTGPELTDLSFVDLPGIVQNAESEVVKLVEDMVSSYIKGTSLILVTLPMSDDIENQKAARLAHLADPEGHRTIGVLTKPDTITTGSTKAREMWLQVIEGHKHALLHGYYCTRQPDDDERARKISNADARVAEASFFKNTHPWSASQHQHRFGTQNLVQSISKLLTQIIRESLPSQLGKVAEQLAACNAQLNTLPPAITTEPSAFVLARVTRFAAELGARIQGAPAHGQTELVQRTRHAYATFKDAVRASAPPFVPYENVARAPRDVSAYTWAPRADNLKGPRKRVAPGTEGEGIMYLEDVRRHIRTSVTRELPGNVPYAAKVSLIQTFQQGWEVIARECFEEVHDIFKDTVADVIHEEFDRYSNLKAIIGPVTTELINSCAETTIAQIHTVLAREHAPFTQNGHYLSECRDKWLAKYKDARAGKGVPERVTPALPAAPVFTFGPTVGTQDDTPATKKARVYKELRRPAEARHGHANTARPATASTPALIHANGQAVVAHQNGQTSPSDAHSSDEDVNAQPATPAPAAKSGLGISAQAASSLAIPALTPAFPSGNGQVVAIAPVPQVTVLSPEEQAKKVAEALASLAALGYSGLTEEDLGKLNKADEYEEELQLMAEVRAYFQVAYKRVIDNIPMAIDYYFLYAFEEQLHERLFERLGLGAANAAARCSAYIAEDPSVVAARDELMGKKKRLENVQRALYNFGL
ncbi:P-loop containing nucleoside triphosphate hydrolase protein [Lenzites betulinus]|nr:P-loop containing nucleoside triphosphate hydrolase protein [Lenzites betulinus]